MRLFKYIIMDVNKAEANVKLNLVKDANGIVLERNALGVMVGTSKRIAHDLDLIPVVDAEVNCCEPAYA